MLFSLGKSEELYHLDDIYLCDRLILKLVLRLLCENRRVGFNLQHTTGSLKPRKLSMRTLQNLRRKGNVSWTDINNISAT